MAQDGNSIRIDQVPGTVGSGELNWPDDLLVGANNGVRWLMDPGFLGGYGGALPVNGGVVTDVSRQTGDGQIVQITGQQIGYGGSFDFSNVDVNAGGYIEMPAGVLASIKAAAHDYFLACQYVRLPKSADFLSTNNQAPFMVFGNYVSGAAFLMFAQNYSGATKLLQCRRQTATNVVDVFSLAPAAADLVDVGDGFGAFAQLFAWRNAAGAAFGYRTANGTLFAIPPADGGDNANDFSNVKGQIGIGTVHWAPSTVSSHLAANNFKSGRAWIEDLMTSTRDPQAVLNADWLRTKARFDAGVFG